MTSGGLRTSVKAYVNVHRVASLAVETNAAVHHETDLNQIAAASTSSYGLCDGNIPCLPILSSATKSCEANQLLPPAPDSICVNGQPLRPEELVTLQTCPNPPKKLKPGNYWYDRNCGFWGKEGEKPSEVISPQLAIGGHMKVTASNGSTQVFINNREITKVELRMLQLVGVECAGNPHFWVYEDGSYMEEGMNNVQGSIWGTAGAKLVCAVLSLPMPSKSSNHVIPDRIKPKLEQRELQKILLLGCNGSGASTILKQAKILYEDIPFSANERESIKSTIQRNVYKYIGILLEVRERFEEEYLSQMRKPCSSEPIVSGRRENDKTPYSIGPKLKGFSDWLLKTMVSGYLEAIFPAATREFAPYVEELWNDSAIKTTYKRSSELNMLPSVAAYFIKRAVHILGLNYEPTDEDILYAEGDTSSNGLACVNFSVPQSEFGDENTIDEHDSLLRYQLIRVNTGLGESFQWLEMFEDVEMVIFCVSLCDYDQFSADSNESFTNRMLHSRTVFESIIRHPSFEQKNFLLLLNKFDLFVKKIGQVPLTQCEWFDDFNALTSRDHLCECQSAYYYIAAKFKSLYASLTGKKLYVSLVEDFESDTVRKSLEYATEILKWEEVSKCYILDSDSLYSTDLSDSD